MNVAYVSLEYHIIIALILSFLSAYILRKDLNNFIPIILFINIFGNGPQVLGYYFYDEFLTMIACAFYLFFNIKYNGLSSLIKSIKKIPKSNVLMILIFSAFMSIQSLRGVLINDDIRIFRWVLFYLGLVPLYFSIFICISNFNFRNTQLFNKILIFLLSYMVLNLFIGIYFEYNFENKFTSQEYFWAGTSYAFYPILIGLIATYSCFQNNGRRKSLFFGLFLFGFLVFMGMYYDSRTIQISTLIFAGSFVLTKQYRITIILILIYAIVVATDITFNHTWIKGTFSNDEQGSPLISYGQEEAPLLIQESKVIVESSNEIEIHFDSSEITELKSEDTEKQATNGMEETGIYSSLETKKQLLKKTLVIDKNYILEDLKMYLTHNILRSFSSIIKPNTSDFTRSLQFQATLKILRNNTLVNKLFGSGIYSHRYVLVSLMQENYDNNFKKIKKFEDNNQLAESRSDLENELTIFRTNSLNAIIIDVGIIGLLLTVAMFVMSILYLLRTSLVNKYQASIFIIISFFWMFFSNVSDIYLFYIFLVPGFIAQILRQNKKTI